MSQSAALGADTVASLEKKLVDHPLYTTVQSLDELRVFMHHHVYAVWDFMSLLKFLQAQAAPAAFPWKPRGSSSARFFINQIVLAEESDEGLPDGNGNATHVSHFELYCDAMREVGADPSPVIRFADIAADQGTDAAFSLSLLPPAALAFVKSTFRFIASEKPHVVGAVFALGRERIIPEMFRACLARMNITAQQTPVFHYYLKRHIHLDEDVHAPLALNVVNEFIDGEPARLREAEQAACAAVEARIRLWDGVLQAIQARRQETPAALAAQ